MILPTEISELLARRDVTDLCLNGPGEIFFDRGRGMERLGTIPPWSEQDFRQWILSELSRCGKSWDARFPFADATLESGHRLHASFPALGIGPILVSLRKLGSAQLGGEARWKHQQCAFEFLKARVQEGRSVLISGSTGSGKTTLLNDLIASVPGNQRILALEDTKELAPHHPHFLSLLSRPRNADGFGEVTLRDLLKQTLRMRPDRIVLGECRGSEVLELLQLLNTGHEGAMATIHASSARDGVRRLELLCLLAQGAEIPLRTLRELVASGLNYVVQVKREGIDRKIHEILRIAGREGETLLFENCHPDRNSLEPPGRLCQN